MMGFSKDRVIYEVVSGSNSYGTSTPDSDLDVRGIFIPPCSYLLGLDRVKNDEFRDNERDKVYYTLDKFVHLAVKNNPNIFELLFVDDFCILHKDNPDYEAVNHWLWNVQKEYINRWG